MQYVPIGNAIVRTVRALEDVGYPRHVVLPLILDAFCAEYGRVHAFSDEFLRRYVGNQLD